MFLSLEESNDSQDSTDEVKNQPACAAVRNGEIHIENLTAYWPEGTTEVRLIKNNDVMCSQFLEDESTLYLLPPVPSSPRSVRCGGCYEAPLWTKVKSTA